MKTAVSVPDEIFRRAESAARRLRVSRSELYSKAVAEYLQQLDDRAITDRLNEVYSRNSSKVAPALHRAQMKSLPKERW
jgi:metal-responsive CopG/Arc/MetJ family transcriptional regulator